MEECIKWTGAKVAGYGVFRFNGKNYRVHRAAFYLFYGYWPRVCRHSCDEPSCYNPHHLLDGDQQANMQDMRERGRGWWQTNPVTHCPRGHEYTEQNTYVNKGRRFCRACHNERGREQRRAKRPM